MWEMGSTTMPFYTEIGVRWGPIQTKLDYPIAAHMNINSVRLRGITLLAKADQTSHVIFGQKTFSDSQDPRQSPPIISSNPNLMDILEYSLLTLHFL